MRYIKHFSFIILIIFLLNFCSTFVALANWTCPKCGTIDNADWDPTCWKCNYNRNSTPTPTPAKTPTPTPVKTPTPTSAKTPTPVPMWTCPACGTKDNAMWDPTCWRCGYNKNSTPTPTPSKTPTPTPTYTPTPTPAIVLSITVMAGGTTFSDSGIIHYDGSFSSFFVSASCTGGSVTSLSVSGQQPKSTTVSPFSLSIPIDAKNLCTYSITAVGSSGISKTISMSIIQDTAAGEGATYLYSTEALNARYVDNVACTLKRINLLNGSTIPDSERTKVEAIIPHDGLSHFLMGGGIVKARKGDNSWAQEYDCGDTTQYNNLINLTTWSAGALADFQSRRSMTLTFTAPVDRIITKCYFASTGTRLSSNTANTYSVYPSEAQNINVSCGISPAGYTYNYCKATYNSGGSSPFSTSASDNIDVTLTAVAGNVYVYYIFIALPTPSPEPTGTPTLTPTLSPTPTPSNTPTPKPTATPVVAITNVTVEGYWNHWRGQVNMFGKQMSVEPHRFLSLETVKINVYTTGYADKVIIRFSPALEAMFFTNRLGHQYTYYQFFKRVVRFPQDTTFVLDSSKKDNQQFWKYPLPLATSTITWEEVRQLPPYKMIVTAYKGANTDVFEISDIDITGNILDLTFIQPVH